VLVNLGRNKIRTTLTILSVFVALFLFCSLRGVLDTLAASIKVGSETRLVTRNAISLIFPLPLAYKDRIGGVTGVQRVGYGNWFGGRHANDPGNFYAQFAVDPTYLSIYAPDFEITEFVKPQADVPLQPGLDPKLAGYYEDRTACVIGEKLFLKNHWKLGQTIS